MLVVNINDGEQHLMYGLQELLLTWMLLLQVSHDFLNFHSNFECLSCYGLVVYFEGKSRDFNPYNQMILRKFFINFAAYPNRGGLFCDFFVSKTPATRDICDQKLGVYPYFSYFCPKQNKS